MVLDALMHNALLKTELDVHLSMLQASAAPSVTNAVSSSHCMRKDS